MDQAAPEIVFRTQGVTKVYQTGDVKVFALAGVDLELYTGEMTVLLGPSGSGKSTLLNILGGLDHATAGRVWFRDTELTDMPDRALTRYRRDHVGFVFQFYNLVPSLTARENVQLVTDVSPDPMSAEEALALVGLTKRMDHFPSEMFGGGQRAPERLVAELAAIDGVWAVETRTVGSAVLDVPGSLVSMVIRRIIALERSQIGLLKAVGYSDPEFVYTIWCLPC
ncbi:ATP-binding cassette domain-containing protein [Loktanella sp. 5RATIMAR09]|uniref:ABC transporter ATP-binding protein n=1 Tax=Loktanella sp. 5RATIMAR09 TaxID=1225655 RepID=UPI000AC37EE8|nr:ATP-binding cassette domain-containing protein [Loktanella sp. 5RATIMAR09]